MEKDVLILISTIVWTLESVLPWLIGAFVVMLLILAVLFIDWVREKRK